jgi:hypothetical protein
VKLATTVHQAVEIDGHDLVPAGTFEFAPPIDDGALALNQYIEGLERQRRGFDCIRVADVNAGVSQPCKVRTVFRGVVSSRCARAPDMDAGATRPEGVCDAIADAARSANDEDSFACEIRIPLHWFVAPCLDRCM